MTLSQQLTRMGACPDAIWWACGRTLEEAWAECPYAAWMLWFAARAGVSDIILTRAAFDCLEVAPRRDNAFAREGLADATAFAYDVMKDPLRAESAVYTALRTCWGRETYPTFSHAVSDDDGCYSADRTALSKQFADIVRKHITVDMFRDPR